MPTLTLSFTLPEERDEAELAQRGGKLLDVIEEFDTILRQRVKYDAWRDERLTRAEAEGSYSLVETLRDILNELKLEAMSVGE